MSDVRCPLAPPHDMLLFIECKAARIVIQGAYKDPIGLILHVPQNGPEQEWGWVRTGRYGGGWCESEAKALISLLSAENPSAP